MSTGRLLTLVCILVAASLLTSGCATRPYGSCNVDRKSWTYVPANHLDDIDIEARRLVSIRSASEFLNGEVVQHWFRSGDTDLMVCRQSRRATDFCFSNFERF